MNLNGAFFSKSTSLEAPKLITKVIFSYFYPQAQVQRKGGFHTRSSRRRRRRRAGCDCITLGFTPPNSPLSPIYHGFFPGHASRQSRPEAVRSQPIRDRGSWFRREVSQSETRDPGSGERSANQRPGILVPERGQPIRELGFGSGANRTEIR